MPRNPAGALAGSSGAERHLSPPTRAPRLEEHPSAATAPAGLRHPAPPGARRSPFPRERGCQPSSQAWSEARSRASAQALPAWLEHGEQRRAENSRCEAGSRVRPSAGPAPCSAVPEACREALGGCSRLCEPHPAGPRWARNAPSRSGIAAQPRSQTPRR